MVLENNRGWLWLDSVQSILLERGWDAVVVGNINVHRHIVSVTYSERLSRLIWRVRYSCSKITWTLVVLLVSLVCSCSGVGNVNLQPNLIGSYDAPNLER